MDTPETTRFMDANWNETKDMAKAVYKIVVVTDAKGNEIMRRRESVGDRKGKVTYSTDPRAGAIMREGHHGTPMSNPNGH